MSAIHAATVGPNSINHVAFNQDSTCVAVGSARGVTIYNLSTHKACYKQAIGAVSIAEMLFCTSLVAYVGAGEQPALTPRKLTVLNSATHKVIQDINFSTSVLAVALNRHRLVVALEKKVFIYALQTLALLHTLDTPHNPKGICALSPCNEPSLLTLPASSTTGSLRVYDLLQDGGNVLCEMHAHKTAVAVLAWSHDGSLLASASNKGTVIRVHRLPQASKAYSFRRGTRAATIHSLAFSAPGIEPPLLCACSSNGTAHIFRLEPPDSRHVAAVAASAAAGVLSSVMKYSVRDMVDPPRSIATVRLPCHGVPAACAILPPRIRSHSSRQYPASSASASATSSREVYGSSDSSALSEGIAGLSCAEDLPGSPPTSPNYACGGTSPPAGGGAVRTSSSGGLVSDGSSFSTDSVMLVVATLDGLLYEYSIDELHAGSAQGPKCSLEGEWAMLGQVG